MFRQWRVLLIQVLMAPLLPCFMWAHLRTQTLREERLRKQGGRKPVGCQEVVQCLEKQGNHTYAANSPDAISTNHILRNVITRLCSQ